MRIISAQSGISLMSFRKWLRNRWGLLLGHKRRWGIAEKAD
jgi:hypothetical protein